jgi:hypothetical protein
VSTPPAPSRSFPNSELFENKALLAYILDFMHVAYVLLYNTLHKASEIQLSSCQMFTKSRGYLLGTCGFPVSSFPPCLHNFRPKLALLQKMKKISLTNDLA